MLKNKSRQFLLGVFLLLLISCSAPTSTPIIDSRTVIAFTANPTLTPTQSPASATTTTGSSQAPSSSVTPSAQPSRTIAPTPAQFDIVVDATKTFQTMEGFGATNVTLVYEGIGDTLNPQLRAQATEAIYGQVQINTGNLEGGLLESPGSYDARQNDDNDPSHINWSGFQTKSADDMKQFVIDPASRFGFNDYYIDQSINVRWASPWLDAIRRSDYNRYLDEAAEQVAAGMIYWRNKYNIVPRYLELFNEPTSGNRELLNGTTQDMVDLVKRAGDRLRREGFANVKFVVPNEETEEQSLTVARAILADPAARQYVGAIGYHTYPYGSMYSGVSNILNTAGRGKPDASRIAVRNQLRDLGKQYGIPVWMTEVSHGGVDPTSFDDLRGRAIHIHDELVYADAAAYYGMFNLWDTIAQKGHLGGGDLLRLENEGTLVMVDSDKQVVYISGMGYAIGHYARWVKRGAVRIDATSRDPLILVTGFRDDTNKKITLVLINNATAEKNLNYQLNGLTLTGNLSGEQSTAAVRWQALAAFAPTTNTNFALRLPAMSVTTIAGSIQ